jgi:hypothetical protein
MLEKVGKGTMSGGTFEGINDVRIHFSVLRRINSASGQPGPARIC